MNKTINRWFQFVVCYIVFRCFCRGEINLVPRNVPWENEQWTLDCSLDRIENTVSIINPKAETVGNCDPASGGRPSACHPADGYTFVINDNIVSMTRKIFNNETGAWTCQHSEDSAKYNLQSPLPRRHYATSFTSYEIHWMSATPGSELTTDTVHTFSVHCGCMSSRLKFVWTIVLLHGKRLDVPRIEGYSERVIPRFITEDYRVHFRISKDMFETIHEAIQPKLIFEHRGGNEQISPRKQLLLFLCYMANNETFRELGQYFGVGKSTAHVCIARVLEAFCEIFLDIIQWPSLQRQDELSREIQLLHMLPNIIGAIDGTHIRLSSCPSNDNDYYNRKGFPSMQLQLVVDNTLKILDVYSGWPGCTHDARVLRNSSLCRRAEGGELFGPNKVIVGDSAYPVKNWLITPFKDNGHLSARQRRFNKALSSFRQAVERTIGHVKGRFRRLRELTIHEPKQIVLTILAGCILHNLCIIAHEDIDLYIDRDNDNHPNNYVNIFQNDVGGVEIRQQMMANLP